MHIDVYNCLCWFDYFRCFFIHDFFFLHFLCERVYFCSDSRSKRLHVLLFLSLNLYCHQALLLLYIFCCMVIVTTMLTIDEQCLQM